MKFTWDEKKRLKDVLKHGIDFVDAKEIFSGMNVSFDDEKDDYGERRQITLGILRGLIVIFVSHTESDAEIRIISARKATKHESRIFYEKIKNQL